MAIGQLNRGYFQAILSGTEEQQELNSGGQDRGKKEANWETAQVRARQTVKIPVYDITTPGQPER